MTTSDQDAVERCANCGCSSARHSKTGQCPMYFEPARQSTPSPMEGRITPEWCENMAHLEVGHDVGAGAPDHPLRQSTPPNQDAVERDISGETVCGFRVAAWRETHPEHGDKYGHAYSEHWSTPSTRDPRVKVERLFTEEQLLEALAHQSTPPNGDAVNLVTLILDANYHTAVSKARSTAEQIVEALARQSTPPNGTAEDAPKLDEAVRCSICGQTPCPYASGTAKDAAKLDDAVAFRALVKESLYHLRLDDGAHGYHKRAIAALSAQPSDAVGELVEALKKCRTSICGYNLHNADDAFATVEQFYKEICRIDAVARAALAKLQPPVTEEQPNVSKG